MESQAWGCNAGPRPKFHNANYAFQSAREPRKQSLSFHSLAHDHSFGPKTTQDDRRHSKPLWGSSAWLIAEKCHSGKSKPERRSRDKARTATAAGLISKMGCSAPSARWSRPSALFQRIPKDAVRSTFV